MGEIGKIREFKDRDCVVVMERNEACKKCGACSKGLQSAEMIIQAENLCEAQIGDEVEIYLEQENFLKAVMILYGIPLISLFVGLGVGYLVSNLLSLDAYKEAVAIIFGVIFIGSTYLAIRKKEHIFKKGGYKPKAIKIVNKIK